MQELYLPVAPVPLIISPAQLTAGRLHVGWQCLISAAWLSMSRVSAGVAVRRAVEGFACTLVVALV